MILQDLRLSSQINQHWRFSGIDHIDKCMDKTHFLSYPYNIDYRYNSRGFRDSEWPNSAAELQNSIWCIGDSFTVGLGAPMAHAWPNCLSDISNYRTINISMDGASNQWITRTTQKIIQEVDPKYVVIMWSYTNRREHKDILLNDEERRIHAIASSSEEDWEDFLDCKKIIDSISSNTVQFAVPEFHPEFIGITDCWNTIRDKNWPVLAPESLNDLYSLPQWILTEMKDVHQCLDKIQYFLTIQHICKTQIITVNRKDLGRDGYHFDLITANWIAAQALNHLKLENSRVT